MMVSPGQGPARRQMPGLPGHLLSPLGKADSLLALAKGTSPHIPSSKHSWSPSLHSGLPGQGLASGRVDTSWKQGVAVETM